MSIDRSLRLKDALVRHRNVLTRAERIERLKDEERWEEGGAVLGLPKVAHRKSHAGKKAEKKEAAAAEGAAVGAEGVATAPAEATPATAGKAAAKGTPATAKTGAAPSAKSAAPAAQKPGKEPKKK
jgi:small basic protein (TIGR04137 family)